MKQMGKIRVNHLLYIMKTAIPRVIPSVLCENSSSVMQVLILDTKTGIQIYEMGGQFNADPTEEAKAGPLLFVL